MASQIVQDRYSQVMSLLFESNLTESIYKEFSSNHDSIRYAAPEILSDKCRIFALTCMKYEKILIEKGIAEQMRQILTGAQYRPATDAPTESEAGSDTTTLGG